MSRVVEGEIAGIVSCEEYVSCIACKAKVRRDSDVIGRCSKCSMIVKLCKCESLSTAKVVVSAG